MKVQLHVKGFKGSGHVPLSQAVICFAANVVAGGVEVWTENSKTGESDKTLYLDADGFLIFEIKNVTEGSWRRFFEHYGEEAVNLVAEGSGTQILDGNEVVGLRWTEGCSLRIFATEIETVEIPPNLGVVDRSA